MSDFTTFIDDLGVEVDNKGSDYVTLLKQATVRALKGVSSVRAAFLEATTSFSTVADQENYGSSTVGFPINAVDFKVVYIDEGNRIPFEQAPLWKIRSLVNATNQSNVSTPYLYTIHDNEMILGPTPAQAKTVKVDYRLKSYYDEDSGDEITTSSTTETNPWFQRGEPILRARVLWDYFGTTAKIAETAMFYRGLYLDGVRELQEEYDQLAHSFVQSSFYLR